MSQRVSIAELRSLVIHTLAAVGLRDQDANTVADALVSTDGMGVHTHGTKLLSGYLKKLQGGGYRTQAVPKVEREGAGWAIVDGDSGLGQVGADFSMRLAMKKARAVGTGFVGLRNTGHIGAAGYYAGVAARERFILMVTGNDVPSVAAPGSRGPVLGSNPLAYAVPTPGGDPILLDIATAAVAGGKVYAAQQRGEPIPPNWLIGPDGQPTTDGSLYPSEACLAPMAGHKGYGLGLWCEILSGVLPGGHITWQMGSWIFDPASRPSWHNASFIAIDVDAIATAAEFNDRIGRLIDEIHAAPTTAGIERVLLPGEREWNNLRQTSQDGIALPADVVEKLREAASLTGVSAAWLAKF
jgi:ureidoglycolate dehydrogenase (NAD+)